MQNFFRERLILKLGVGMFLVIALVELLLFWFYEPFIFPTNRAQSVRKGVVNKVQEDYRTLQGIADRAIAEKIDRQEWLRDLETACRTLMNTQQNRMRIWIESDDGKRIAAGFAGKAPSISAGLRAPIKNLKPVFGNGGQFEAAAPLRLPNQETARIFWQSGGTRIERGKSVQAKRFNARLLERLTVMLVLGLGAGAGLLFLSVYILVLKPLRQLNRSMAAFAGGDLDSRAAIGSQDEVGRSIMNFNQMADKIQMLIAGTREFSYNLSHELNSPLYRIQVSLELLRRKMQDAPPDGSQKYLESIEQSVLEMNYLVLQILQISKHDLKAVEPVQESVDVKAVVDRKFNELEKAFQQKDISVTQRWESVATVDAVSGDMDLMISNLIGNALKFTPDKGRVLISGAKKCLSIANTCKPLSAEEREKVFKPFYRSAHPEINGHGVGLAVCAKIAKTHGWHIEMQDWEGKGMEVRLCFEPEV